MREAWALQEEVQGPKKCETGKAINSVTVGATGIAPEPLLQVQLASQLGGKSCTTTAVADTGAQVCVAGPTLMALLVSGLRCCSVGLASET